MALSQYVCECFSLFGACSALKCLPIPSISLLASGQAVRSCGSRISLAPPKVCSRRFQPSVEKCPFVPSCIFFAPFWGACVAFRVFLGGQVLPTALVFSCEQQNVRRSLYLPMLREGTFSSSQTVRGPVFFLRRSPAEDLAQIRKIGKCRALPWSCACLDRGNR